ncbi:MAG: crossover junction endodeoxyribonuclease RuvC [Acidobacteria bacterium]|nr:crossover junction endodeoxyribonuclease RuvC [Acidobacteriota bacterium]
MRRVLGIDCGSGATGYGLIDTDGRACRVVASGVILTKARFSFPQRLRQISEALGQLLQTYSPDAVAVEDIFYSVNVKSALKLGQVRGVALLKAAEADLPVHEYSPLEIKSSVVGYGRAEKSQVQHMVTVLLNLEQVPPEDAADALAVAICHAHHAGPLGRLSSSQPSATEEGLSGDAAPAAAVAHAETNRRARRAHPRSAVAHAGRHTAK